MKQLYKYCLRCGKPLKLYEYRIRGYGPVCWELTQKRKRNLLKLKKDVDK